MDLVGGKAKVEFRPRAVVLLSAALGVVDALALDCVVLVDAGECVILVLAIGDSLAMFAIIQSVAGETRTLSVAEVGVTVPLALGAGAAKILIEEILAVQRIVDAEAAVELGVELAPRIELAVIVRVNGAFKPVARVVAQAVLLIEGCGNTTMSENQNRRQFEHTAILVNRAVLFAVHLATERRGSLLVANISWRPFATSPRAVILVAPMRAANGAVLVLAQSKSHIPRAAKGLTDPWSNRSVACILRRWLVALVAEVVPSAVRVIIYALFHDEDLAAVNLRRCHRERRCHENADHGAEHAADT